MHALLNLWHKFQRITLVAVFSAVIACPASADERSESILSKYFEALGGRNVWADGHGEYVLAKVNDPRFPLPATFEFCTSWQGPQTADRSRFQDLTQLRVFTGRDGWTFMKPSGSATGEVSTWDEKRKGRGFSEWSGNFEVLTHRLARRDPHIRTRMGEGRWKGWIDVSVDSNAVAYLLIGDDGRPKRFYRVFDDASIVFGPLADRGRIRFPAWGSFDGGEPFDLIAFEILNAAPVKPFGNPDPASPGYLDCR